MPANETPIDGYGLMFGSQFASPTPATPSQAATDEPIDGVGLLFGTASPAAASPPAAEPKKQGWGEWIAESVKGKHDPAYDGIPTVLEQHKPTIENSMVLGSLAGGSDAQLGDIIQKSLGDKFIRRVKDANGYDVFVTKGDDGQEQYGYLNSPGLDAQDVGRGVWGAVPYVVGGGATGAAAKAVGAGALLSTAGQAAAAGATSLAGDLAQIPMGSQQGVDPLKAVVMAGTAGLGEAVASYAPAVINRFIREPRYYNRSTGELTDKGKNVAKSMGLDPTKMADDFKLAFAKTYSASPNDAQRVLVNLPDREFNIPSTIGQRLKDPEQLMREKAMRSGVYGVPAKETITALDKAQREAIARSVQETVPSSIANRQAEQLAPISELGERVYSGLSAARRTAKKAEDAAWKNTGTISVKKETASAPDLFTPMTGVSKTVTQSKALPLLSQEIKKGLGDLADVYGPEMTPTAYKMGTYLDNFMRGKRPSTNLHSSFGLEKTDSVDAVRKAIGLMVPDAELGTDKAAAKAIYKAFDDWLGAAAEQGMLSGDRAAVAAFRTARDVTKEMHSIFAPKVGNKLTPGGRIIEQIQASADTPERVVSTLFSGPKAEVKQGAVEALGAIKKGLERYSDPAAAAAAWNDIRLAHWAKTTMGANGEVLGAQALRENLKHALTKQSSLINKLYSETERNQIQRLVKALERVTYKDPNPSGTATGLATLTRQFFDNIVGAIPFGRTALEYSGIPKAYGAVIARKAVGSAPTAPAGMGFVLPAIRQGDRTED